LRGQSEILSLIRYSRAAGDKSFEFFVSFDRLRERLGELKPQTSVIAFRQRQLPLRGVVDDEFIARCVNSIPDRSEFLVVETVQSTVGHALLFHHEAGATLKELREALERLRGNPVAVGKYPHWRSDSPDVISAYVPDEDGKVRAGIY